MLFPFGNITVISEHNLGSACEDSASMLSEEEASPIKEKAYRRDKGKSPLFGEMEGKKLSELLVKYMHEIKREIKGMRREISTTWYHAYILRKRRRGRRNTKGGDSW